MDIWNLRKVATAIDGLREADPREVENLAGWVWEEIMGFSSTDEINLSQVQVEKMLSSIHRMATGEPVQYIAGHAWFYGMKLKVTSDVLIPRPETEELVAWIFSDFNHQSSHKEIRILDIGTGSGCIAIALKNLLKSRATVFAIDISKPALEIAASNAKSFGQEINFIQSDFLIDGFPDVGLFDIIVSNPPYISDEFKKTGMSKQLEFEPDLALYPGGNDPDIFYKKIADTCSDFLLPGGAIYLEMNEFRFKEIRTCFMNGNWTDIRIKKDMQGAERMLKANSSGE